MNIPQAQYIIPCFKKCHCKKEMAVDAKGITILP